MAGNIVLCIICMKFQGMKLKISNRKCWYSSLKNNLHFYNFFLLDTRIVVTSTSMVDTRYQYGSLRFNFQSSHIKDLQIGNLSTQLESEIDETRELSGRVRYTSRIL